MNFAGNGGRSDLGRLGSSSDLSPSRKQRSARSGTRSPRARPAAAIRQAEFEFRTPLVNCALVLSALREDCPQDVEPNDQHQGCHTGDQPSRSPPMLRSSGARTPSSDKTESDGQECCQQRTRLTEQDDVPDRSNFTPCECEGNPGEGKKPQREREEPPGDGRAGQPATAVVRSKSLWSFPSRYAPRVDSVLLALTRP